MNTFYVTTSIPYVNARPHIGFALELVQADAIARWQRLLDDDVFLLTGTDENALKNVQAASREGLTTRELCDRNAALYQDLVSALGISADGFIRSSSDAHREGASRFWQACRPDDISLERYQGLYCVGCEDFYLDRDLVDGRCPTHNVETDVVEEENYFFRLSRYQKQVEDLLESGGLQVVPEARRNEALGFVRQGLRDFSISRIRERSGGWGIQVPGDPSQVLYVWFDALTNYLTGIGYGSQSGRYSRYWADGARKLHVIGKDILKFHAVYWPAMLLSAGLPLPDTILVHGFLTVEGQKIGKSLGNAVDPLPLIDRYGSEALRYYLLREVPVGSDGDVSETRLREVYNSDLANGLGNLVRRLETLCERAGYGIEGPPRDPVPDGLADQVSGHRFHSALRLLWDRIRWLNRSIESSRPWDLLKRNAGGKALHRELATWTSETRSIARGLSPFLPGTAERILGSLSRPRITRTEALFARLR
jgi:methionyl-tRNA synthetase